MPIMTAVFEVPDGVWELNPFDVKTPFGRPVAVALGNILTKRDEIEQALDRRGLWAMEHVDGTFTIQEK